VIGSYYSILKPFLHMLNTTKILICYVYSDDIPQLTIWSKICLLFCE